MSGARATLNLRAVRPEDLNAYFVLFREVQALHVAERPDLFQPPEKSEAFERHFADAVAAQGDHHRLAGRERGRRGALQSHRTPPGST